MSNKNANKCNLECIIKYAKLFLVLGCSIVFLYLLFCYSYHTISCPDIKKLRIEVDTVGMPTSQAKILADSIILEIRKQEALLEDKYQYFIEQESRTQDIIAIGGVLLGIIVSIVGFFGLSTMTSIEEKARRIGEESAKEAFEKHLSDIGKKELRKWFDSDFKPTINRIIEEENNKFKNEHLGEIQQNTNDINDLREKYQSLNRSNQTTNSTTEEIASENPDFFNQSE